MARQPGNKFKDWLYQSIPAEDLLTRLFLVVSLSVSVAGFVGVFLNYFIGLDLYLSVYCGIIGLFSFGLMLVARFKKKAHYSLGIFLALFIAGFLIFFWPLNGGYEGPILLYFLSIPVFLAYFLPRIKYYVVLLVVILMVSLVLTYYFDHPERVIPYPDPTTRLVDVLVSFVLAGVILGEFSLFFVEQSNKAIKEIEKKNELINIQYLGLLEIDEYKNNIFASLSHDLRGPINSAKSIFEILIDDQVSKEEKETLVRLATLQMEETSNLVENILLWAKSQMGGINPEKEEFSINDEINHVLENLRSIARGKQIFIQFVENGILSAFGDKSLFTIVLRNLINNAIKFSSSGTVITVLTQKNIITKEISISVKDQGAGLTQKEMDSIFFSGKSTIGTHKEKGTGIGLKLSKIFTEINGGKISVASEKGVGSIFTFTIPHRS